MPYLWPQLRCPLYATPFTASVLRRKLEEAGLANEAPITLIPMSGKVSLAPFEVELITLTHSIPEPNAVVIRTQLGAVLHTGDWKLDPTPLVGETTDEAALAQAGRWRRAGDGVRFHQRLRRRRTPAPRPTCAQLAARADRQAARTGSPSAASPATSRASRPSPGSAMEHGRQVALVGRSLWRMVGVGAGERLSDRPAGVHRRSTMSAISRATRS